LLIFRRTNCIITVSGIVTLCKRPYSMPVESGLQYRLVSSYQINAHFLYSITIYMLRYNPQHVSSSTLLIFRRTNCIITASGIVTLCKRPYSMPVESGLQYRLVSSYQLNAYFLYSITIYMLHYNPQHVSSSTLLIFRRTNCIITVSGIVTLSKRPYSMPVDSGLSIDLFQVTNLMHTSFIL